MDAFFKFKENPGGDICISSLDDIVCRTLIVYGAKDPMVPSFHPEFIVKRIKQSKLFVMPEGKHNLHMRYYEEFNKIVTDFILEDKSIAS